MVLSNGEAIFSGLPEAGIETYLRSMDGRDAVVHRSLGTGEAVIHRLSIEDERGVTVTECQYSRPWRLSMDITVSSAFPEYDVSVTFMSGSQELVAQCHSRANRERLQHDGSRHRIVLEFSAQLLNPGRYWLNVAVFDKSGIRHLCWEFGILQFTVVGGFIGTAPVQMVASWYTTPVGFDEQTPTRESSA